MIQRKPQHRTNAANAWPFEDGILESYYYGPGPAESMPNHFHEDYQLCLTLGGSDAEFHYRGTYQQVPVNSLSILHPGEIHRVRQLEDRDCDTFQWMLYVSPLLMQRVTTALGGGGNALPFFSKMIVLDQDLIHLYLGFCLAVKSVASPLEQDTLLFSLLSKLIQQCANVKAEELPIQITHQQIQTVQAYLDEHFAEHITLDQLAQIAHLSPYHLNRIFSQTVGLPPHKYRVQLQVERARVCLLQGMPLKQVAAETGFADQSHLTRHFKRLMRVTPGQYQRQDCKTVQDVVS